MRARRQAIASHLHGAVAERDPGSVVISGTLHQRVILVRRCGVSRLLREQVPHDDPGMHEHVIFEQALEKRYELGAVGERIDGFQRQLAVEDLEKRRVGLRHEVGEIGDCIGGGFFPSDPACVGEDLEQFGANLGDHRPREDAALE